MGVGILSLIVYIAAIIIWNVFMKRNIGEAMVVSWLIVVALGGGKMVSLFTDSLLFAATQETLFAAMAFAYMAAIMKKTGLVYRLVDILNSIFGKIAGGAAYIATIASALFGMISGSGSGNAASVGTITIPWMINSGWKDRMAATIVAGNAGLGIAFPPCSTMFLLLAIPIVSEQVNPGDFYLALFAAGIWNLLYRMILVRYYVKRDGVAPIPEEMRKPLSQTLAAGWTSLLMFLGIIIPLVLTMGPVSEFLKASAFGSKALKSISLIVWIPILITWISIFEGWKSLPKSVSEWMDFNRGTMKSFALTGAVLFFAFAAGRVMTKLGLGKEMTDVLASLDVPSWLMILLVGIIVTLIAGPLSSTATTVAIGAVAYSALTMAGVDPVTAVVLICVFCSTEGASPPSSAPIFIASGLAQVNPAVTFRPLIFHYVIPTVFIGLLIGIGVLPI